MTQNWNDPIMNFLVICLSLGTCPCCFVFKSCDLLLTPPLLSHPKFGYSRPESTLLDRTLLFTISDLASSHRCRSTQRSPKAAFQNWDTWLCLVIIFKAWLISEAHLNTFSTSSSWLIAGFQTSVFPVAEFCCETILLCGIVENPRLLCLLKLSPGAPESHIAAGGCAWRACL